MKTNRESLTAFPATADSPAPTTVQGNQNQNAKKTFAEPELSSPVDVIESTTFFQSADSGATI